MFGYSTYGGWMGFWPVCILLEFESQPSEYTKRVLNHIIKTIHEKD